jgi:hypothetical protein
VDQQALTQVEPVRATEDVHQARRLAASCDLGIDPVEHLVCEAGRSGNVVERRHLGSREIDDRRRRAAPRDAACGSANKLSGAGVHSFL